MQAQNVRERSSGFYRLMWPLVIDDLVVVVSQLLYELFLKVVVKVETALAADSFMATNAPDLRLNSSGFIWHM